jgi:hypothetical protein
VRGVPLATLFDLVREQLHYLTASAEAALSNSRHLGVRFSGSGAVVVNSSSTSASMFFSAAIEERTVMPSTVRYG